MNLLPLVLALGVAGGFPAEDRSGCQPHSRPWQVHLHGGGASCSGALIDPWWIVTSSVCSRMTFDTIASLGEHDVTVEEDTEQHISVAEVIHHRPYRSPLHSLAMVRLSTPARLTQYVQPIPLPSRCPKPGETCHVSGWGSTIPNQDEPAQQLKCITVPVVDDKTCMNTFPEDLFWSPGMICAGRADTSNCLNDRGSVMVCDGQLQGVQWLAHGCWDPADPSVYTKLCMYNSWINSVMDRYTPTTSTAAPPVKTV